MYTGALTLAGLEPGSALLDIGTGRGDALVVALGMGAASAVGVDYSPAAIELARRTIEADAGAERARVELADARRVPVDDGAFDLATMLDVVEHLDPAELDLALREARRALRPGGRLFIHTAPNAIVYDVTYRLQRRLRPGRARRWPADPRSELERRMHVNEQRLGPLRRAVERAGFERARSWRGRWIHADFVPDERARRLYPTLARYPLARRLVIFDLFASGVSPG